MDTFLNTLHVVLAVLVIGPLLLAPFAARRAIARRDPAGVRTATVQVAVFGAGSVVVAGLGVGTVLAGDRWTLATPWVIISSTLYVVALGLVAVYLLPALRHATGLAAQLATATSATTAGSAAALGGTPATDGPGAQAGEVSAADGAGGSTADVPASSAEPVPEPPAAGGADESGEPERDSEETRRRLDGTGARVAGAGWLLVVTLVVVTVLMTVRPFGP